MIAQFSVFVILLIFFSRLVFSGEEGGRGEGEEGEGGGRGRDGDRRRRKKEEKEEEEEEEEKRGWWWWWWSQWLLIRRCKGDRLPRRKKVPTAKWQTKTLVSF